jgi:hypothetical protein
MIRETRKMMTTNVIQTVPLCCWAYGRPQKNTIDDQTTRIANIATANDNE